MGMEIHYCSVSMEIELRFSSMEMELSMSLWRQSFVSFVRTQCFVS